MKNRILTSSVRTIRRSFPRFLSLLVMSMLGVFAFAGLQATAPDMMATLDNYLKQHDTYDVRIVSTLGLSDADVEYIRTIEGVEGAEGVFEKDAVTYVDGAEYVLHVSQLPHGINTLDVREGRLPENAHEMAVEKQLPEGMKISLGDTITLENDDEAFCEDTFTVVGIVDSALYYNYTASSGGRGSTSLGSGTVNYYVYVHPEAVQEDYYTVLYCTMENSRDMLTGSADYEKDVTALTDAIQQIREERQNSRREELVDEGKAEIQEKESDARKELDEAKQKLDDAAKELEDGRSQLQDAEKELADAGQELQDSEKKLKDAASTLNSEKQKLQDGYQELEDANHQLSAAQEQLYAAEAELNRNRAMLEDSQAQLDQYRVQLDNGYEQLVQGQNAIDNGMAQLQAAIGMDPSMISGTLTMLRQQSAYLEAQIAMAEDEAQKAELQQQYNILQGQIGALEQAEGTYAYLKEQQSALDIRKAEYEAQKSAYDSSAAELAAGWQLFAQKEAEFNNALQEYWNQVYKRDEGYQTLADGEAELKKGQDAYASGVQAFRDGKKEYEDGQKELEDARTELAEHEQEYADGEAEYLENADKLEKELADAYEKLDEIPEVRWFVYDRSDYGTYSEYLDDTASISNLAGIFPVIFFAVAILVSLISMNRMVEDDRVEIGTLKSLGFSNGHILVKYLLFAMIATLVGGLIGAWAGSLYLPYMISNIYRILFDLPKLTYLPNTAMSLLGTGIALLCVGGTAMYTALKELKEKPAELMRPRAPKSGKRTLLEHTFLWKHFSFSRKIIIRNIFRYKKRVLVTVFGIAGCTALLLCGFGIRDAIQDIPTRQYGRVFVFDGNCYINGEADEVMQDEHLKDVTAIHGLNVTCEGSRVHLFAAEDDALLAYTVQLHDYEHPGALLHLEEGKVILSEKFAQVKGIRTGDTVELVDTDNRSYVLEVSGLTENYVEHYAFVDRKTLEACGTDFHPNMLYFHMAEGYSEEDVRQALLDHEEVISVSFSASLIEKVGNMLKSLDKVVLILVVLSALLAFVVLFNLSNININERRREIATLKVLGFYDREVDSYITAENTILTLLGIAIGLFAGSFLTHTVVATVEIEKCRFIYEIRTVSYLYAGVISFLFTMIVNVVTHFTLKRINMIDSLKSVE